MRIILGSKSPRRQELLKQLGYEFEIVVSNADEKVEYNSFEEMVTNIALKKANAISKDYPNSLIICADTTVICNNMTLGKPKDKQDAYKMINSLQNNTHEVLTGVVLIYNNITNTFVEKTKVTVLPMTDDEINDYINSKEPYDKAGAYGIQGEFAKYISKIDGDYYNVMGLPICRLYQTIKEIEKTHII